MPCGKLCLFSLGLKGLKQDPWPYHRNLTSQAPNTHSGVLPTTPTNVYDASWRNATLGQKQRRFTHWGRDKTATILQTTS